MTLKQVHEAFHTYLDDLTWDGSFDWDEAQKISIMLERAFEFGARYAEKAEREECAAHIASWEAKFLDLKTHALGKQTKRCSQCMTINLRDLAHEISEGRKTDGK